MLKQETIFGVPSCRAQFKAGARCMSARLGAQFGTRNVGFRIKKTSQFVVACDVDELRVKEGCKDSCSGCRGHEPKAAEAFKMTPLNFGVLSWTMPACQTANRVLRRASN